MKVLHVNDYHSAGGCEVLIDVTVRLLREHSVKAELFTSEDVPGHRRTPVSYLHNRRACRTLKQRIQDLQPDVVHLHNFYHELSPGILGMLGGIKRRPPLRVLMTMHDFHLICPAAGLCTWDGRSYAPADPQRLDSRRYLFGHRWDHRGRGHSMLKIAQHWLNYHVHDHRGVIDLLICPSRFSQRCAARLPLDTVFLPHPAPPVDPAPPEKPRDALRWVFAGRIEPEKGLVEFLNTLPNDFPGHLMIIGDGSLLETCRRLCAQRGFQSRVEFTGWLPGEETRRRIASAHVLILPSRCPENAPVSLLEALASRTNILVAQLGGMKEVVETARVGYTFELDDPSSLGDALGLIETDFEHGKLNAIDVARYLEERTPEKYVERLLAVYGGKAQAAAA